MIMDIEHLRTDANGILVYRRKFPRALVPHIPSRSPTGRGRVELKVSLRAKSLSTPGATERLRAAQAEFDAIVEVARRRANHSYDVLTDALVDFLAQTYKHDLLDGDDAIRWGRRPAPATYASRGAPEEVYDDCREMLEDYDASGLVAYWRDWACDFALAEGYVIDPHGLRLPHLCRALAQAACETWLSIDRRIDGKTADTPQKPTSPDKPDTTRIMSAADQITLSAIAEELMTSKVSPLGQSTIQSWSTALRFFSEVHGNPPVNSIDRRMVSEWLELLAQRPAAVPKAGRNLTLAELAARHEGDEEITRVSRKTLRGHLASLATIWNKAVDRGIIVEDRANPFKARKELAGGDIDQGPEFTMSELKALFDLPVFATGDRPTRGRGDACYWMPLLLLWTGIRPEEAAQLMVTDFEQDDDTGTWLLTITDEGMHPVKGARNLKTDRHGTSGRRTFAVPQELKRLGLIDYVTHLRAEGELALFPLLTVKNKRGHLYSSVSEWWGQYIREQGVVLEGHGRRPYRDFRQTWATAAREAGIPEEAMSYLMGHSNKRGPQTRKYGQKHAHGLRMVDVAYPKLDLSRVKPWRP